MTNNENRNEEMNEETTGVVEEIKESKFKGLISKAGESIKKHGKKVAGVAAIAAVGVIGYALGHKVGENDYYYEDDDTDVLDPAVSDVVESTEE